jgi:polysaccharide biosynthesis/export protein
MRAFVSLWSKFFMTLVMFFWMTGANAQLADYEIGAGDTVKISVFQSPELAVEARVSEDGTIGFPLIGRVKTAGLSTQRVERNIAEQLKIGNFIKEAQVSVSVVSYRSQQVSILGYVAKPGRYPLLMSWFLLVEVSRERLCAKKSI